MEIPREPLLTAEVSDDEFGYKGWVVIHAVGADGACGGVRLYPDVSKTEVQLLAHAMTHKYAFFGKEMGGAKGGYQMPFDLPWAERKRALNTLGRHLEPLMNDYLYHPWTDMNSSAVDLEQIFIGAGMEMNGIVDSSYHTALSTFSGILAAAEYMELAPEECTITIEGYGNVGTHLGTEIRNWGGKLIGCATRKGAVANPKGLDIARINELQSQHGDDWVKHSGAWDALAVDELHRLPMKIHVPCARVHSITKSVASELSADAIVPAANVPCTPDAQALLESKGIVLLPDFIINGGGITGSSLGDLGEPDESVRRVFTQDFRDMLVRLLKLAESQKKSTRALAVKVAECNYSSIVESAHREVSLHGKLIRSLQDRHILPQGKRGHQEARRLLGVINQVFR